MRQQELNWFEDRNIVSVSQIVESVKGQLENNFRDFWVRGEISNFRTPPSGHCYFTLKDSNAQLKAVCFRLQNRLLKFQPEDGTEVLARGSLTVYPPRGDFQLVVESMEPVGQGALQLAFEQLKSRLQTEGLFDEERKRKLPLLPSKIGVVTSPTGAAIQDVLRVLAHRNDRLNVLLFPTKVQGSGAAQQIAGAIQYFNTRRDIDVVIVTRGGGSLEDLWAFNEEEVARAVFDSDIPVISAVGHEIDFTISDFVADLRAPTPSAAAETVSAVREDLSRRVENLSRRSDQAVRLCLQNKRNHLQKLASSRAFVDAESRLRFFLQRLDELQTRLMRVTPDFFLAPREKIAHMHRTLRQQTQLYLDSRRQQLVARSQQLQAYSPLSVLERGYSIVSTQARQVVRDPDQVKIGEDLDVRVAQGRFRVQKV